MLFPKVTLVDTSSLVYQSVLAKHAQEMSQYAKHPLAGPVYLLMQSIRKLVNDLPPPIFVFDGYPQHKYNIYPEYKNRGHTPDKEVVPGLSRSLLWEFFDAFFRLLPCSVTRVAEAEADGVIASLTHFFHSKGWKVNVVTKDQDLFALHGMADIQYLHHKKGRMKVDDDYFREAYGDITPEQVQVYKAFFGDASDNLPRVSRVPSKLLYNHVIKDVTTFHKAMANIQANAEALGNWHQPLMDWVIQGEINYKVAELEYDHEPLIEISRGFEKELQEIFNKLLVNKFTAAEIIELMRPGSDALDIALDNTGLELKRLYKGAEDAT